MIIINMVRSPLACSLSTNPPRLSHRHCWNSFVLTDPVPSDRCSRSMASVGKTTVLIRGGEGGEGGARGGVKVAKLVMVATVPDQLCVQLLLCLYSVIM